MAAAATAAAATAAQPAPWRPDLATAKALGLLCLASLSVGFAAVGAATVAIVACDYDEACAVHQVLAATSVRALVFAALLAPIAPLLIVRAAVCDTGFRDELIIRSSGTCRYVAPLEELSFGFLREFRVSADYCARTVLCSCAHVHFRIFPVPFKFAAELMFNYGIVVLKELAHNYLEFFIASIELQISFIFSIIVELSY